MRRGVVEDRSRPAGDGERAGRRIVGRGLDHRIDAVGLDVLLWLLGAQFIGWLAPMAALALPVLRRTAEVMALPAATVFMAWGCWLQSRQLAARAVPARWRGALSA